MGFDKNCHIVCRSDSFSTVVPTLIAAIAIAGYVDTCTRT